MSKTPQETLWKMEPHTAAKHSILRGYLDAWLPIMAVMSARWASDGRGRLVLLDGFCGPGRYAGGEDGSPIIMLKAFLEHARRDLIKAELVYIFIDEDRARIDHLETEIAALAAAQPDGKLPDQVRVDVIHGRYEDVFSDALDALQQAGQRPAPTFAFIDPFGYTDATMGLTDRILQFERCEALIYMPLPHVLRFIGIKNQQAAMDGLFGSPRWREAIPLRGDERRQFLHDLFRDQLASERGDRLVRSFEIPTAAGNGYHLFFTTNHEKGLEVMKNAMWAVDPVEGRRFRDSTRSDQMVIFEEDVDTSALLVQLQERFGTDPFSIEEAESFTIRDSAYRKGHLKTMTLVPAERAGKLTVLTARSRACTYPARSKLQFL